MYIKAIINGKNTFLLIPDMSLARNNDVLMIFNAKYMEVFSEEGNISLSQDDVYKMLTYSIRFNFNQIKFVYP
jgi:5-methylcytosine-specific restriction endonuclease McrBC regulatory subunit McrC